MISTLSPKTSVSAVLRHVGATYAYLDAEPLTQSFAPTWKEYFDEGLVVLKEEILLCLGEDLAQGKVRSADRDLDKFAGVFEKALRVHVENHVNDPRYVAFMGGQTVAQIKKPVLGPELDVMMNRWQPLVAKTADPAIKAFEQQLTALVERAKAAVTDRAAKCQTTSEFRTIGHRQQYIEKLNAARKLLWGRLAEMQHTHPGLPSNFADQFFLHESRVEQPAPTVDSLTALIEGLTAQLRQAQTDLADLQKDAEDSEEQRKARAQLEAELAEAEKASAEQKARILALRAKLQK
ncbi:MAG: hypothetical protein MUF54_02725 [Polyangiaceae bacterium]|jgi:hypothetical protein|nr:hypothetical protein [Polyangiaceae bacterium]